MRKFTSLMLMLLCAVTTWAFEPQQNITSLDQLTDGGYVCFRNVGRNKYIYEDTSNKIITGAAVSDLGYVWQAHVEDEGKFSFTSVAGRYISTPIDGGDVLTVEGTNNSKDKFTITAHPEDNSKWLIQSNNNPNIYWDAQDARFVGWAGNGANSRYEIITVDVTAAEIEAYIFQKEMNAYKALIATKSETRVGAYIPTAVQPLEDAIRDYEAENSEANKAAVKEAYNNLIANGKKVELTAGEIFTVKCVEDARGYMAYSTVEGKGSETQVYLAGTNKPNFHAAADAEGIYKEWAITTFDGKNYLYNIEKKQFISADGVVKFTDTPVAFNFVDIGNALWEIQFESNNKYLSFSPGWGADCVRTESGVDNGCKFYLDKTGNTADEETVATVEVSFVNAWKGATLGAVGYVGGYPASDKETIEAVTTLSTIADFESTHQLIGFDTDTYYRFVCVSPKTGNSGDTSYNTLTLNGSNLVTAPTDKANINQIFKLEDAGNGKFYLKNMNAGKYLNKIGAGNYRSVVVEQAEACKVQILPYGSAQWEVNNSEGAPYHSLFAENHPTETVPYACAGWDDGANSASAWHIIPATDIEITINSFASICLPFAVEIPTGVKAYSIEDTNSTHAILTEKADIPANQGAILAGKGTFKFNIVDAAEDDWTNNKLAGTTTNSYIAPEGGAAYVLANGDNGIGLYKAALNCDETGAEGETHFLNNANKAYFAPSTPSGIASYSFDFDWNGTTGIEGVVAEGAQNGKIYDITGREVKAITAPGIYIVNGRKVVK